MAAVIYENNPHGDNIVIIPSGGGSEAHFDGLTPATINQGASFDLTAGVKAYDESGNEVPFTVEPTEIDACQIGNQTFTYTAGELTQDRIITVQSISDPVISGLTPLTVEVNEEFDPLDGVSAVDGNGNSVEVTVEEPTPTERLLVTGGAENVSAFEGSTALAPFTPVFTEPYEGDVTVKINNLQTKDGDDGEWVAHPSFEYSEATGEFVSSDNWGVSGDIYLENSSYIHIGSAYPQYVYENGDMTMYAKWDSIEVWTKTE